MYPIITKTQAERMVKAKGEVSVSLDLGQSTTLVEITKETVAIGQEKIPIADLKKVKEERCYIAKDGQLIPVSFFSKGTNLYYKLLPTKDWPTITLSSTPMHRHKHLTPKQDTELKMKEISPVLGNVLDTCCGLGYTAILASKDAEIVYTFDQDQNVQHIASFNPYSQELFTSKKIVLKHEDIGQAILAFPAGFFSRIVHDPPTFKYAPELYSAAFHKQLFRVLKKGGILYHYCPQPQKTKGHLLYPRLIEQLKKVGFSDVFFHEWSSGVRAVK